MKYTYQNRTVMKYRILGNNKNFVRHAKYMRIVYSSTKIIIIIIKIII